MPRYWFCCVGSSKPYVDLKDLPQIKGTNDPLQRNCRRPQKIFRASFLSSANGPWIIADKRHFRTSFALYTLRERPRKSSSSQQQIDVSGTRLPLQSGIQRSASFMHSTCMRARDRWECFDTYYFSILGTIIIPNEIKKHSVFMWAYYSTSELMFFNDF